MHRAWLSRSMWGGPLGGPGSTRSPALRSVRNEEARRDVQCFSNGQNMTLFNGFIFQVYSSKTRLSSSKSNSTAVAAMTQGVRINQTASGLLKSGAIVVVLFN